MHIAESDVLGAEIRFRYEVDPDQRDAARAEAEQWAAYWMSVGAVCVNVEEVVSTTQRARAPEIVNALTLADKLHVLWNSRNTCPDAVRAARLIQMAGELEQSV